MQQYAQCPTQYIAFIHGHKEKTWHQRDLAETLQNLQWSRIPGYTDINRNAQHKLVVLDHKGRLPSADIKPAATGSDVYNGTFARHQVGIMFAAVAEWSEIGLCKNREGVFGHNIRYQKPKGCS